jgi:molybdopterin-guanine dinucleotide biosynthesis protein A
MALEPPAGALEDRPMTEADAQLPPAMILAGGAGSRIGGGKPFVTLGGRPLLAHVLARIEGQSGACAINGCGAGFEPFGLPVLPDARPGLGPLGGMLTAMRWAAGLGAAQVLTVAVDTPFLPLDLVARLRAAGAEAAFAVTEDGAHATTGLWSVDLADPLADALDRGLRKVRDWTAEIGAVPVHFDDAGAFFNVNTPEDLRLAEARLSS